MKAEREFCRNPIANLFVVGASVFPTLTGYPATATISALSYRTAEYITRQRDWFGSWDSLKREVSGK